MAALAELVDDPADLDTLLEIRARIDPLARDAAGALRIIPVSDRYGGPHAAIVMGPFLRPGPSRFSPGTFGVLYAGDSLDVAVRESAYHAARYLSASAAPAGRIPRVALTLRLDDRNITDVRRASGGAMAIYNPDPLKYGAAQRLGHELRQRGADGVWYDSVRAPGGTCYGIFRPAAVTRVDDISEQLAFVWDGARIDRYEIVRSVPL
ncbi:MAG: RES family NAD+ phosphorylase [Candidatus Eremiobacteraeota bacterium]|nr:RES family NAD+ phosphorylase [Candidatus Eremiobacteraeota bacterium]